MQALIADLDDITATFPDDRRVSAVATALVPYLSRQDLLAAAHRRSASDRYRTNLVHVGAGGTYSVVALVWRPGQRTPIHSHRSWCVVGVHEGRELERTFRHRRGRLVEHSQQLLDAGTVTWLAAGDDDIHDVSNATSGTTVSIHVYGLDYRATASSILNIYTHPTTAAA
jgi:3-mercaptopropionate dioxygenase